MTTLTTGYGGVAYPDTAENVDIPADMLAMATSLNAKVLGVWADTTARNSAYGTLPAGTKAIGYLVGQGVQVHNGTTWEWVGKRTPTVYSFVGGGAGSPFNGTITPTQWNTVNYTFTPTDTGFAEIYFECDANTQAAGFGYAFIDVFVSLNGGASVQIDSVIPINDAFQKNWTRWRVPANTKLIAGQSVLLTAKLHTTFANGTWGILGMNWKVVQQ